MEKKLYDKNGTEMRAVNKVCSEGLLNRMLQWHIKRSDRRSSKTQASKYQSTFLRRRPHRPRKLFAFVASKYSTQLKTQMKTV